MAGLVFSVLFSDEHQRCFKISAPFVMRKMWFLWDEGKKICTISVSQTPASASVVFYLPL